MPLSDYQAFYNKAMTSLRPGMDAETENYKAALADQGILSSTGGQGAIQSARQNWLAKANQSAMDESYRQQGLAENQRQFGVSSAMKVWEMLNAKALAQKSLDSKSKPWFPGQTDMFGNLAKQKFLAPSYSPGGMTGDPKEQQWPMRQEMNGNTDAGRALDQNASDNAANRAIQSAYLKLAQQKAAKEEDANDPWANITAAAFQNSTNDIDPERGGFQAQAFPTQLMAAAQGTYGIDVMGEAKGGNEKAIAVVKMMYPQTWRQKLGLEDRTPTGGYAAALGGLNAGRGGSGYLQGAAPQQAASPYQGWKQNVADASQAVWGMPDLPADASIMQQLGTYAEPTGLIGGTARTLWEALTRPR